MKSKVALTILAVTLFAFLVGCATIQSKLPGPKPLAKIVVFVGDGMRSASGEEISIGSSKTFRAEGRDEANNPVSVGNPVWTATNPGIVEITPSVGPKVTIKGVKEGTTDIVVESGGVKKVVESIYVR